LYFPLTPETTTVLITRCLQRDFADSSVSDHYDLLVEFDPPPAHRGLGSGAP
jgi:hypothetical protein